MPRTAREKSSTGIYHVILRGNNRQKIFHTDEDYVAFLKRLREYRNQCGFRLYAYCLMDNHIHLLLEELDEPLELIMRRLCGSFVYWYNRRYDRVGHLFQDRFRSETVEDDQYLATVLRYIHRNPVKAGLCSDPVGFSWSSYRELLRPLPATSHKASASQDVAIDDLDLTDRRAVMAIFHTRSQEALQRFREFHTLESSNPCLDIDEDNRKWSDEELHTYIQMKWKMKASQIRLETKDRRYAIFGELLQLDGISGRQLARVAEVSPSVLWRLATEAND